MLILNLEWNLLYLSGSFAPVCLMFNSTSIMEENKWGDITTFERRCAGNSGRPVAVRPLSSTGICRLAVEGTFNLQIFWTKLYHPSPNTSLTMRRARGLRVCIILSHVSFSQLPSNCPRYRPPATSASSAPLVNWRSRIRFPQFRPRRSGGN